MNKQLGLRLHQWATAGQSDALPASTAGSIDTEQFAERIRFDPPLAVFSQIWCFTLDRSGKHQNA
ncbi:hypothetical protein [Planctomycetes bacterium SV_7m_r]|uniref:hypothetical protein n=1 Tax=Stieleria bergensis TaxID=2528025 RepID=UPI00119F8268